MLTFVGCCVVFCCVAVANLWFDSYVACYFWVSMRYELGCNSIYVYVFFCVCLLLSLSVGFTRIYVVIALEGCIVCVLFKFFDCWLMLGRSV